MNRLRSLIVLPLAAAAFLAAMARGQLTCHAPQQVQLGATPTATLLSFPAFEVTVPCRDTETLHHAAYHRFTAPQGGWYSLHAVPTSSSWKPRVAILASCDAAEAISLGLTQNGNALCDDGGGGNVFSSETFRLEAGQSRILVIGGETANDAGTASLRIERVGSMLTDGAQPLVLGSNTYAIAAREPTIPFAGACSGYSDSRLANASRFSFVPPKSGTYRFSFCGSFRTHVALSSSPEFPVDTLVRASYGCPGTGTRLITTLQAGITYYIAAGNPSGSWWDACSQGTATVEFVPPCPADFNDDDVTDGVDLGILLAAWGTPARDITGDGTTDGVDLGILLAMWGTCPEG